MTLTEAIEALAEASVALEKRTGYPAIVSAAQAALETGWLKHAPGNNPFGIKALPGEPRQLLQTTEWFTEEERAGFLNLGDGRRIITRHTEKDKRGRTRYTVMDWFAAYPSLTAAFDVYGRRLTAGRYKPGWDAYQQHRDPAKLVDSIAGAGYATDPNYASTLRKIIAGEKLNAAIAAKRG